MNKTFNKYITTLDCVEKTLLVLPGARSGVSLYSFTTVIGTPVETASAGTLLVFLISNGII